MAVFLVGLVFFLTLAGFSDANYCVCNTGQSDSVLQKNIDFACGAGADCSPISQNGPCYNPNTVRDHCNYAVNSYYQRKGNIVGSCDFQGTATVVSNPPSASSGCVYPSSPSNAGTAPPAGGTPGTPTVGGTPATPTVGGTPATPNTGGGSTNPGTVPGSTMTPGFGGGLGPTSAGSGFSNTDGTGAAANLLSETSIIFTMMSVVLISGYICPMI